MLFYSIAHYYDVGNTTHYKYGKARIKNKYKNIESHINAFKKVENKNKAFVLTSSINDKRGDTKYDEVKKKILEVADSTVLVQSEGTKIRLDKSAISQSSEDQLMTK